MTYLQKISLFLLRISLGWVMFYAGITKVLNSSWSAEGYLKGAKTFPGLFQWFLNPGVLPIINFVNEWGLTLLGASLILGIFVRLSSILGIALMVLYYLPVLEFPYIGKSSYIVDDHIIYALILLYFSVIGAGKYLGFDGWMKKLFRKN